MPLTPLQKIDIVIMRKLGNRTIKEIAEYYNISEQEVKETLIEMLKIEGEI